MKQILLVLLIANVASAEITRYIDKEGRAHYVTDESKVPDEYRDQIDKNEPLPQIGKVPSSRFVPRAVRPKPILFVTTGCHWCDKTEEFLKQHKVSYTRYDISKSRIGRKKYAELKGVGVPIFVSGQTRVYGYRPAQLKRLIDNLKTMQS